MIEKRGSTKPAEVSTTNTYRHAVQTIASLKLLVINSTDLDPYWVFLSATTTLHSSSAQKDPKSIIIIMTAGSNGIKQLVKRFQKIPITLYRIQPRLPVSLRDYDTQMAKGRTSYDLKLNKDDGLVHPAHGDEWIGPNGMSLRPGNDTMLNIIKNWKGDTQVYRLQEGTRLPDELVILHERDDHYSFQTTEPVTLEDLNVRLTDYLEQCPKQTKEQFIEQMEDFDDQDN